MKKKRVHFVKTAFALRHKCWLRLLHKTDYLTEKEYNSMNSDINELIALLVSITKKVKAKQKGKKDDG